MTQNLSSAAVVIGALRVKREYGHMECSMGKVKTASDIEIDEISGPGRPR